MEGNIRVERRSSEVEDLRIAKYEVRVSEAMDIGGKTVESTKEKRVAKSTRMSFESL
jgi:hypothetical protein